MTQLPGDPYRTLGVGADASTRDLRAAYLRLARAHHPDTFEGAERAAAEARMQSINEAWNVVGTPHRRAEYDRSRPRTESTTGSQTRGRPHFRPFDDDPLHQVDVDLDPTPISGSRQIPQWVSLMPIAFVVSGLVFFGFGLLVKAASIVAFAAVVFAVGVIGFIVLPLVVMSRADRDPTL